MSETDLKEILHKHKLWLAGLDGGERADLRYRCLKDYYLSGVNLRYANLHGARLSGADIHHADLTGADLSDALLIGTDFRYTKLCGADFTGSELFGAKLFNADLSDAKGLTSQWEFLKNNFDAMAEGIIAYKTFGKSYPPPSAWRIEKGAVISENVNFDRTNDCGCGINVATLDWLKKYYDDEIWQVLIRWEWLAGVCVFRITVMGFSAVNVQNLSGLYLIRIEY
ncbi:MAG: pentapeptide repeat-containing protein [Ruminococcus sp.]|nr:pentapeptide repeat-containing protein [Ruminococcus sp.]